MPRSVIEALNHESGDARGHRGAFSITMTLEPSNSCTKAVRTPTCCPINNGEPACLTTAFLTTSSASVIGFKPIAKQSSLSSGTWINVLLRSIANSRPSTLMQPRRGAKRRESKLPAAKRLGARQDGRSSKREGILEVIKGAAAGLSRREILDKMGLKGNKSGEMSVSNALTALTKAMHVRREGGKYHSA